MPVDSPQKQLLPGQQYLCDNWLWVIGFLFIWGYATYAHLFFGEHEAEIALTGFSALDFANSVLFPENFIRDYPGGAWNTGKSTISWIYPFFLRLGIPAEITLIGMVGLEIFTVAFGANLLMHTIFKNLHPFAILLLTALLVMSWIRFANLARFGSPYFHGQFYGYADGLRLLAISFYLSNRYRLSGFMLLIGFTIHPIKTIFGLVFIAAMHIRKCTDLDQIKVTWPYILFCIFAVAWAWLWLGFGKAQTTIPSQDFFHYSALLNYHWYPQDVGVLDKSHWLYMTPFVASILISIAILMRSGLGESLKTDLFLGLVAIVLVSMIGITIAWFELSVSMVKISLQRASVLALSIATILLVAQTVRDIFDNRWWFALLGISLVSLAFVSKIGWPILIAVCYLVSTFVIVGHRKSNSMLWSAGWIILCFVGVYQIWLFYEGYQKEKYWVAQLGILVIIIAAYQLIKFLGRNFRPVQGSRWFIQLRMGVLLFSLVTGIVFWGEDNRRLEPAFLDRGNAYKEVQIWARQNTGQEALFMVDPCQPYGWRDYSRRSSYGSMHEWYKTGWLYSGDGEAFSEGLLRGQRLGIRIKRPSKAEIRPQNENNHTLFCDQASKNYYLENGEIIKSIASDYDIQYFVFDKIQAARYGGIPSWPVSYENDHYAIIAPPGEQDTL